MNKPLPERVKLIDIEKIIVPSYKNIGEHMNVAFSAINALISYLEEREEKKCRTENDILICYCGKCEPENYPLPRDFPSLTEREQVSISTNLRDNKNGSCDCRPLGKGCFFSDGFGGQCDCKCHTITDAERLLYGGGAGGEQKEGWETEYPLDVFPEEYLEKLLHYSNGVSRKVGEEIRKKVKQVISQTITSERNRVRGILLDARKTFRCGACDGGKNLYHIIGCVALSTALTKIGE